MVINISIRNVLICLTLAWKYSPKKDSIRGHDFWLVVSRRAQSYPDILRLATSAFGWFGGMARIKIGQNERSILSLRNNFHNLAH